MTRPDDIRYPFQESIYTDPLVVYHGTTSAYSRTIEIDGFGLGSLPFSLPDIRQLVEAYTAFGQANWHYTVLKGLSAGLEYPYRTIRPLYFSQAFWHARDYASNIGGETIHHALLAIEHLEAAETIRQHPEYGTRMWQMQQIKARLLYIITGRFPVVYAVRVDKEWFTDWKDPEVLGDFLAPQVNLACHSSVPVERILAKAEYTNGIDPGYTVASNLVLSWQEAADLV